MSSPLPRSLDPLPQESIHGYLLRLAHRLALSPRHVAELIGVASTGVIRAENLLTLDAKTKLSFARATKLTEHEVDTLLLLEPHVEDRYLPLRTGATGQLRQLRGIADQEQWVFTRLTRWCPQCLAGDGSLIQQRHGGPWKKQWHLPVVFACPQHRRLLDHLCPSCNQTISTSGPTAHAAAPGGRNTELHPAQCRTTLAPQATVAHASRTCGTRLDSTGSTPGREYPPSQPDTVLRLQDKILDLLDPHGPAATSVLGHQVPPTSYFTDLRILATLISASWPAGLDNARQPALMSQLDTFLRDRHERIATRLQHKSRPPKIVLHEQPPWPADACAALQRLNRQGYGGSGSRVSPVEATKPISRSGRYWMRLSRLRTMPARWSTLVAARLPRLRLTCDHTPSVGLRSGA